MNRDFKGLRKVVSVSYNDHFKCFCLFSLMIIAFILLPKEKFGFFNSYTSQLRSETDFSTS